MTLLLPLLSGAAAAAPTWPSSDSGWTEITQGGTYYQDPPGDITPEWVDYISDSVGGTDYPGAFWAEDWEGMTLQFRIRVSSDGTSRNVDWQVLLDTDVDGAVEWALVLSRSGQDKRVALDAATQSGAAFSTISISDTDAWRGAIGTYSRWTNTEANLDSTSNDYWLDLAIDVAQFAYLTEWDPGGAFSVAFTSSASHTVVNRDFPQSLGTGDPVSSGLGDSITSHLPEPGTLLLVALGIGAVGGSRLRRKRRKPELTRS